MLECVLLRNCSSSDAMASLDASRLGDGAAIVIVVLTAVVLNVLVPLVTNTGHEFLLVRVLSTFESLCFGAILPVSICESDFGGHIL